MVVGTALIPGVQDTHKLTRSSTLQAAVQPQTLSFAPTQLARFLAYLTQGTMGSQQSANADAAGESWNWLQSMLADCERLEAAEGHSAEASFMLTGHELALPRCALCSCAAMKPNQLPRGLTQVPLLLHFPWPKCMLFFAPAPAPCAGAAEQTSSCSRSHAVVAGRVPLLITQPGGQYKRLRVSA